MRARASNKGLSGLVLRYLEYETTFTEGTQLPGTNFVGPFTHTANKIVNGIGPTTAGDEIALFHDIDYIRYSGDRIKTAYADAKAIGKTMLVNDYASFAIKAGLTSKLAFDSISLGATAFNDRTGGFKPFELEQIANELEDIYHRHKTGTN